ncbi:MAG: transporter ATPase [Fibrobacteres bacterium]|nr:transporter ATPase [Fibrobacterota bacterium]
MSGVISARGLRVEFRSKGSPVEALRGVDFELPKGSLYVLLGPNGAGKTTLMRCITGLVRPTGGSISVFGGEDGGSRARLARLGVLIENPGAYGRMNTREYLAFFGSFFAIPDLDARIRAVCGEMGLELSPKPVAKLSQGNRQKLQLARSILHRPELLLWDEPTDHLDPASQQYVLAYLRSYLAESGATALVATHRLEQMEAVASHFGFLARGKLLASGGRNEILEAVQAGEGAGTDGTGTERARLGFSRPMEPDELAWLRGAPTAGNGAGSPLPGSPIRIEPVTGEEAMLEVSAPDLRRRMPELIKALVERGLPLASAEPRRATLAEAYQRLVGA